MNNLKCSAPRTSRRRRVRGDTAIAQRDAARAATDNLKHPTEARIQQARAALEQAKTQRAQAALNNGVAQPWADGTNFLTGQPIPHNDAAGSNARSSANQGVEAGRHAVASAQALLDQLAGGVSPVDKA